LFVVVLIKKFEKTFRSHSQRRRSFIYENFFNFQEIFLIFIYRQCPLGTSFPSTPSPHPLSRSFWSILNFAHQSSQIDELFNNPDLTLEELLDDDNIISEFKSMNPRLLELYLSFAF